MRENTLKSSNNAKGEKSEKIDRRKIDWENKILKLLLQKPLGLTITDIAKGIDTSRITVSKYLTSLLAKEEVFAKEIGVYKLYFSSERSFVPMDLLKKFYIGLLNGLTAKNLTKEDFKEFGYSIANSLGKTPGSGLPDNVIPLEGESFKPFLKYFGTYLHYFDIIYDKNIIVEDNINEDGFSARYTLSNIDLLELSSNFIYHFHILSGVIEKFLSRTLEKEVSCTVKETDLDEKTLEISIKINQK